MGWFDEQLRIRKDSDNEAFEDSFLEIAGAVLGKRASDALNDDRQITEDAIGDILKYYHVKPQNVPDSIRDMNEVLEYHLRPYGIMRRSVHLDEGWYRDASGAMLGTRTDDNSVVALIPNGISGYRFYDRKAGKFVRLNRKTQHLIDREAIAFYNPFPVKKMTGKDFVMYIIRQISLSDILLMVLLTTIVTLIGMLTPRLTNILFSDVIESGSVRMLNGIGIFMIAAVVSGVLFTSVRALIAARVSTKLNLSVEAASMMRVLSLPADFFKKYSAGDLSNRIRSINGLPGQIISIILSTFLTAIFSLVYISQIFIYAPSLVRPALIITLITFILTIIEILIEIRVMNELMKATNDESGLSYQLISGIQKIRLSGAERRAFAKWAESYSKTVSLKYDHPLFLKLSPVITLAVTLIGTMVMYALAYRSGVSTAEYYAFTSAYGLLNTSLTALTGIVSIAGFISPVINTIRPILEEVPEISEEKHVITRLSGQIELSNVSFRYEDSMPNVIDNVSLKIRPGQYVAIVGSTGCGKSTLMRLMLGFEKPQKGAVYYDGKDLSRLDLKSLRRKIGTVMQDGKLITGDLFQNITVSAPWLTLDDAWEAAEAAGMADTIRELPMGMQTMISEGHESVSGGQRQRILIARAVAPKPKILMFDEATSALDNITQKIVSDSLEKMKCTRIVIAHRLSTIRQCDRIIVLDNGSIAEDGTFEELMAKNGIFTQLVSRQMLDMKDH